MKQNSERPMSKKKKKQLFLVSAVVQDNLSQMNLVSCSVLSFISPEEDDLLSLMRQKLQLWEISLLDPLM